MAPAHGTTRRGVLQGGIASVAILPGPPADSSVTGRLARYMVEARDRPLPPEVLLAAKHRILDTFAAMVSGARMHPGEMALAYVRGLGGAEQAGVVASDFRTSAVDAALAMAEKDGSSGEAFVRAVVLGYDLCCRLLLALGPDHVRGTGRSAEGTSSTFSALGAAASLAQLDERGMRFALSYASQQVSGLWSWVRDEDHVEKAFDFAGMGARNGVTAATMVQAGLTGVADVLDGRNNLLSALSTQAKPELMLTGLGSRFFVTETAIKTFSVGYPIQSPLDAILTLRRQYGLTPATVAHVLVKLPTDAVGIVGSSAMPDVSCQHLVALALVKGAVSFSDSHDAGLMRDPAIQAERAKVEVAGDPALMDPAAPRGAVVIVTLADGRTVEHFTKHPPGTKENPLSTEAVNAKARDLMAPVLGAERTDRLIARVNTLEAVADVRELRPLLMG